jgi:hypothetical protein
VYKKSVSTRKTQGLTGKTVVTWPHKRQPKTEKSDEEENPQETRLYVEFRPAKRQVARFPERDLRHEHRRRLKLIIWE